MPVMFASTLMMLFMTMSSIGVAAQLLVADPAGCDPDYALGAGLSVLARISYLNVNTAGDCLTTCGRSTYIVLEDRTCYCLDNYNNVTYTSALNPINDCGGSTTIISASIPTQSISTTIVTGSTPATTSLGRSDTTSAAITNANSNGNTITASATTASSPAMSTVHTTTIVTITSCGPEHPHCTAGQTSTVVQTGTMSTVYETVTYTITSCAPTVTHCPGRLGSVTTEVVSVTEVFCPLSTDAAGGTTGHADGSGSTSSGSTGNGNGSNGSSDPGDGSINDPSNDDPTNSDPASNDSANHNIIVPNNPLDVDPARNSPGYLQQGGTSRNMASSAPLANTVTRSGSLSTPKSTSPSDPGSPSRSASLPSATTSAQSASSSPTYTQLTNPSIEATRDAQPTSMINVAAHVIRVPSKISIMLVTTLLIVVATVQWAWAQ